MNELFFKAYSVLAQAAPWEEPPEAPPAPPPKMGFGDLQKALHAVHTGETDQSFRNGAIMILGAVILLAVLLHYRQRRKSGGPPDSMARLARELARCVPFPFGTRMLLWWVSKSTATPMVTLMISSSLFEKSVERWVKVPTFTLARRWGKGRLERLKHVLFA